MTGKKVKRILLSVLCFILCYVMIQSSSPIVFADETTGSENSETDDSKKTEEDYKEEISNLQDEQVKLQQQMTEYNNKINNIKGDKKKQQALANSIDEKISIIEESIAIGKEKIVQRTKKSRLKSKTGKTRPSFFAKKRQKAGKEFFQLLTFVLRRGIIVS